MKKGFLPETILHIITFLRWKIGSCGTCVATQIGLKLIAILLPQLFHGIIGMFHLACLNICYSKSASNIISGVR